MPTWGELLTILSAEAAAGRPVPLDELRRTAIARLTTLTGRPTVVYATRWVQGGSPDAVAIGPADVQALMEVLHGLKGPALNIVLHSSGGSATATEAMVNYIRTKFDEVHVFVPFAAMSAATMLACSADVIVMGKHSSLGPIDPQVLLQTSLGTQWVPAFAIRDQFQLAQEQAADPKQYAAWIPMLQQYGPALLVTCDNVIKLSEDLVRTWLAKWMFRKSSPEDATEAARNVARQLNDHKVHLVHDRFLSRDRLKSLGLNIEELETKQDLQDAALTILHMLTHTFTMNPAVTKVVENNAAKAVLSFNFQPQRIQEQPPLRPTGHPAPEVVPPIPGALPVVTPPPQG
jgi:hypothetical protein